MKAFFRNVGPLSRYTDTNTSAENMYLVNSQKTKTHERANECRQD